VTPGLQYGANDPRSTIRNTGNLTVGNDLILSGGNLNVQGQLRAGRNLTLQAQDTVQIRDSLARPFIAAAGGELLVEGKQRVDIFALNHPQSGLFSQGDMVLRSANTIGGDA
ncbi:MAG TPA: hemagglutination activity domain protein, partial [Cyanobacteria bacterium UBA11148]|nr:hemagglutination activity domain protein [Cyanobacteria bacterium UBA11148]